MTISRHGPPEEIHFFPGGLFFASPREKREARLSGGPRAQGVRGFSPNT